MHLVQRAAVTALLTSALALGHLGCHDRTMLPSTATSPSSTTTTAPPQATHEITIKGIVKDKTGAPVGGATVTARSVGGLQAAATQADGHFSLKSIVVDSRDIRSGVEVHARALDYWSEHADLDSRVTGEVELAFTLALNPRDLPAGHSLDSALYSILPSVCDGPAESDCLLQTRSYQFHAPVDQDIVAELVWTRVANVDLRLWASMNSGVVMSRRNGDGQVLLLRRGTAGRLVVGQAYEAGRLSSEARFTLTTHKASN